MSIEELEDRLRQAEQYAKKSTGNLFLDLAAHEAIFEAQRGVAAAKGLPYAKPLDIGVNPGAGVSGASLSQSDRGTVLHFSAVNIQPGGYRTDAGTATVEFTGCTATQFGYPGDKALKAHALYGSGLSGYGVFEVMNSLWLQRMKEQHQAAYPASREVWPRHFVFTFRESTFECLADEMHVTVTAPGKGPVVRREEGVARG